MRKACLRANLEFLHFCSNRHGAHTHYNGNCALKSFCVIFPTCKAASIDFLHELQLSSWRDKLKFAAVWHLLHLVRHCDIPCISYFNVVAHFSTVFQCSEAWQNMTPAQFTIYKRQKMKCFRHILAPIFKYHVFFQLSSIWSSLMKGSLQNQLQPRSCQQCITRRKAKASKLLNIFFFFFKKISNLYWYFIWHS